jgi:mono/diheme cytochrome c family protein
LAPLTLAGGRVVDVATLERGRAAYLHNCYACHGKDGDGRGPAAAGMRPPPRNFQQGRFKFAGVPAGALPTDEALDRVLRRGLHGTPMLAWDISDDERSALIQYLKTFKPPGARKSVWEEASPGEPIPVAPDPWADAAAAIERGKAAYHVASLAGCAGCHPAYVSRAEQSALNRAVTGEPLEDFRDEPFRSDLRETQYPVELDAQGELAKPHRLLPPDFLFHPVKTAFPVGELIQERGGARVRYTAAMQREDLYRVIAAGIDGALMPTWLGAGTLTEKDLWALAHYVQSLMALRETPAARALRERLEGP